MNKQFLTVDGYVKLRGELSYLIRTHRPEITSIVSWAASLGDRSENADYTYNKRKLREIDRRIRHLTKLFEVVEKVEYNPVQEGKIFFGAWCELENENGDSIKFRIVGDEEIFNKKNYISPKSPMAKACLGKAVNDEVKVQTPGGEAHWRVIKIEYNTEDEIASRKPIIV